jgi:hypothetical protein
MIAVLELTCSKSECGLTVGSGSKGGDNEAKMKRVDTNMKNWGWGRSAKVRRWEGKRVSVG